MLICAHVQAHGTAWCLPQLSRWVLSSAERCHLRHCVAACCSAQRSPQQQTQSSGKRS